MPAQETYWRNLGRMHVVFFVSAIALFGATIWMMAADHRDEWRGYQVTNDKIRAEIAQREEASIESNVDYQAEIERLNALKAAQQKEVDRKQETIDKLTEEVRVAALAEDLVARDVRIKRARRDVARANYDLQVRDEASDSTLKSYLSKFDELQKEVDAREFELQQKQAALNAARERKLAETRDLDAVNAAIKKADAEIASLKAQIENLAPPSGLSHYKRKMMDFPILDGFNSPHKVVQDWMPDLLIKNGMSVSARFDRCRSCHLNIDSILADGSPAFPFGPTGSHDYKDWVDAGKYPHPFATHPRTDLYLTSSSPHKLETFGCTACHDGQGSGTSFTNASHTPNDPHEEHIWAHEHGYASNHFWEYPMQPKRLRESTCLKCHHTVTELAVNPKFGESAPQLVHGWNLIKEYGCFGCHEINGYDGGKAIGPDIRLEPQTDEERLKIAEDPTQVAGQMRKVGPSLRHVASKVTQKWLEEWTDEPKRFRPSTRMPQFYHLTNQHDAVAEKFTPIELAGISHYLFGKSEPLELEEPAKDYVPDPERGRRLFKERGCLACHSHAGPEFVGANQTFGPSLERVHAKLRPEDTVDLNGVRFNKWLYTWIRNPESYHPRTRMPNLYLAKYEQPAGQNTPAATVDPAADIAAWLMQSGEGGGALVWDGAKQYAGPPLAFEASAEAGKAELQAVAQRTKDLDKLTRLLLERAITKRLTDRILGSEREQPSGEVSTAEEKVSIPAESRYPSESAPPIKGDEIELVLAGSVSEVADKSKLSLNIAIPLVGKDATLVFTSGDWQGRKFGLASVDANEGMVTLKLSPADRESDEGPKPGDGLYLNGTITQEMKLRYVGRKTISKYGCYGCHDIPGFESARPIGTALQDWGRKDPSRLAPEHIHEYLHHHGEPDGSSTAERVEAALSAARSDEFSSEEVRERELSAAFFYESLLHHGRPGFIWQKLRQPRSYDYEKIETKGYDERLKMPKFPFTEKEIEAISTFVLGLVAEPPADRYVYTPTGAAAARLEGERLLEKYHCTGCHSMELPQYKGRFNLEELPYFTGLSADEHPQALELLKRLKPFRDVSAPPDKDGKGVISFHGSQVLGPDPDEDRENQFYNLRVWENLNVNGQPLRPMAGVETPADDLISVKPARGGGFAFWLIDDLVGKSRSLELIDAAWNKAPPTLYKEGIKVQTPWLYRFLKEPYQLRHTTVLRMPRFNMDDDEARALANYFAAAEGVSFPYQDIPQRDEPYLSQWRKEFAEPEASPDSYLGQSWRMLTKDKHCTNCHSVAGMAVQVDPSKPQPRGPDLKYAVDRVQPEWLMLWLYNPKWVLPYTPMPALFLKSKPPDPKLLDGNPQFQAIGTRDALMNYHRLLEQFGAPEAPAVPAAEPAAAN